MRNNGSTQINDGGVIKDLSWWEDYQERHEDGEEFYVRVYRVKEEPHICVVVERHDQDGRTVEEWFGRLPGGVVYVGPPSDD